LLNGVVELGVVFVVAVLAVSVPVPVVVVDETLVLFDELPLLLQDQTKAADKQMAKESNFFFIKWFLCGEVQKIYASPSLLIFVFKIICYTSIDQLMKKMFRGINSALSKINYIGFQVYSL